jgi:hypothetical protein
MAKETAGEELDGRPGAVELLSEEEELIWELLPGTLHWGDDRGGGGVLGLRGDRDCAGSEGQGGCTDGRGGAEGGPPREAPGALGPMAGGDGTGGGGSRIRGGQLWP